MQKIEKQALVVNNSPNVIQQSFDQRRKEIYQTLLSDLITTDEDKREAFEKACNLLYQAKNKVLTIEIKDIIKRQLGINKKDTDDFLKQIFYENYSASKNNIHYEHTAKYGFAENGNQYIFSTQYGDKVVSNCIMTPLFHLQSDYESKRFYEFKNVNNESTVIDFTMNELNSIPALRCKLEAKGNFLIFPTLAQFDKIKLKIYQITRTAQEIRTLGWQPEGSFWAWVNGISTLDGKFIAVDEYGLVQHEKLTYFIGAQSKVYADRKLSYKAEAKFKFCDNETKFIDFATLYKKVHGQNASLGICFWIATTFRDHILDCLGNFPILNLFGPKGSGKNEFAKTLSSLNGQPQDIFNINNGTKAGLAEFVQQFRNAIGFVDEYKNSLDYQVIETLKQLYNAVGRTRLTPERRKEATEVHMGIILAGQEMPTADIALFTRLLFLKFNVTEHTHLEKQFYSQLLKMQDGGLSHFTHQIIKHRVHFINNFIKNYKQVLADLGNLTIEHAIEDRILQNWSVLAASLLTMQSKLEMGFDYETMKLQFVESIISQNNQTNASNEISDFWESVEALFDRNILLNEWHFKINFTDEIKLADDTRILPKPKNILRIKFNAVHGEYAKYMMSTGKKPMPKDSLRYYLENSKYFFGVSHSVKFTINAINNNGVDQSQVTSAYIFDYDALKINLLRTDTYKSLPTNDNLPF